MILPPRYTSLGRTIGRSFNEMIGSFELLPDDGYIFVYTDDNQQLFDDQNRAVQVDQQLANS
jgi:hypothetical protein